MGQPTCVCSCISLRSVPSMNLRFQNQLRHIHQTISWLVNSCCHALLFAQYCGLYVQMITVTKDSYFLFANIVCLCACIQDLIRRTSRMGSLVYFLLHILDCITFNLPLTALFSGSKAMCFSLCILVRHVHRQAPGTQVTNKFVFNYSNSLQQKALR